MTFLIVYILSGLFGEVASAVFLPGVMGVGACEYRNAVRPISDHHSSLFCHAHNLAGAVCGLFGAHWADIFQNWSVHEEKAKQIFFLFFNTVITLGIGLIPMVDNFAHVGGFLYGVLMGSTYMMCVSSRCKRATQSVIVLSFSELRSAKRRVCVHLKLTQRLLVTVTFATIAMV